MVHKSSRSTIDKAEKYARLSKPDDSTSPRSHLARLRVVVGNRAVVSYCSAAWLGMAIEQDRNINGPKPTSSEFKQRNIMIVAQVSWISFAEISFDGRGG